MEYVKVVITSTEFNANKTYYLSNGNYVQCTASSTYSFSTNYYTRNPYFTIDIDISTYRLSEIIKSANYGEYVYLRTENNVV